CFLQTLPLASNALAIRIIFPSVRAIRASFNPTGLPASLGKQKSPSERGAKVPSLIVIIPFKRQFAD
ncbi:hypothetical protein ABMY11_16670, partial [Vibrio vulnificus]